MVQEPWRLTANALPTRPVHRASLLIGMSVAPGEPALIVLDSSNNEFVRVPDVPNNPFVLPLSLAPDGTSVLFIAPHNGARQGGLCLHTLATGRQEWFDARAEGQDLDAALSPDGTQIATLTSKHGEDIVVTLIDLATHSRHLLWSAPGSSCQESTISWSPNGHRIAATYFTPDEEWASVAIDASDGTVLRHYDNAAIIPSANGAWAGDHELLLIDDDINVTLEDLATRSRRNLGAHITIPLAVLGDHLIEHAHDNPPSDPAPLTVTDLNGRALYTAITIHPPAHLDTFDIAPTALPPL